MQSYDKNKQDSVKYEVPPSKYLYDATSLNSRMNGKPPWS